MAMKAERGPAEHITKRTVDALRPGEIVWDDELKGFGVRCRASGAKYYVVKYRADGRQRWYTIGQHGSPWTIKKARDRAKVIRGKVADGTDPAVVRDEDRDELTISELCDLYLAEGCATKKPSTLATDKGRIKRHIKPLLGRKRVRELTRADVQRFMHDVARGKTAADIRTKVRGRAIVTGGKGTATRTVGLLGGILSFAIDCGMRSDNPVRGVKRYKDKKSERFLSARELTRLGTALVDAEVEGEHPSAIAGIRLLALTGCRKSEIVTLQWVHVDLEHRCLRLSDSKTGAKVIPLGAPARELLASMPRLAGNPYALPGRKEGGPYLGLPKAWERIRARAGLSDVRLHDLRHSFASVGASGGDSLLIIGALMGHRDSKTTQRYAHLADDPLRQAADRIASQIDATMRGNDKSSGEVVKLRR